MAAKEVLIIGGNFAGISVALMLAKMGIKVVLVSPNDAAYYAPVTPRVFVETDKVDKLFIPHDEVFKGQDITTIEGVVKQLMPEKNKVVVQSADGSTRELSYQYVIIATGSRAASKVFKPFGDRATMKAEFLKLATKAKNAKTIAVVGGGAVGVEVSGELRDKYPDTTVDLYTGTMGPLYPMIDQKGITHAEKALQGLGVNVINKVKAQDLTETSMVVNGKKKSYDLLISAIGVTPNTDFIPKEMLDDRGYLKTDQHFVNEKYPNVMGYGEVLSVTDYSAFSIMYKQPKVLEKTIQKFVLGQDVTLNSFSKGAVSVLVPIGKNNGVGYLYGYRLPTFVVKFMKSRDYMIPRVGSTFK